MAAWGIIVVVAVFAGVFTLVTAVGLLLRRDPAAAAETRLASLTRGGASSTSITHAAIGDPHSLLSDPLDAAPDWLTRAVGRLDFFERWLTHADLGCSAAQLATITLSLTVAGFGLPTFAGFTWPIAACGGVVGALGPIAYVAYRRHKRLSAFAQQLPAALELIGRALRAGHGLAAAIQLVASESADPIAKEFRRCSEEQQLGVSLDKSLDDLAERVPNLDLRFFATAVILQRRTGGDLAEVLDKIGHLIRERFKLYGQVQALTAEGRLSGVILLGLPPLLFAVMWRLNPDYCRLLFVEPLGQKMLAGAAILQVIGAVVIHKIIRIKV